ncbi:hypothetical protein [Paenibacillus sp. NPDC057934]|uniref:hypothetical protein n=1 Tax=Paenibacillus sp. NPDC057934 TaxID=3346282 RepID=UPI0036D7E144
MVHTNIARNQITIEIDSLPTSLNPLITTDYTSRYICSAIYEGLRNNYNCSIVTNDFINFVVKISQNYLGNAFELFDGLMFHLNSENKSVFARQLFSVKNAMSYYKGESSEDNVGIVIIDADTLLIKLSYPCEFFISVLESNYIIPIRDEKPIETGPYKLSGQTSETIELTRNNFYCSDNLRPIHTIVFKLNNKIENSLYLFENGLVDITCHTQFLHTNMYLAKSNIYNEVYSSLMYTLYINDSDLKEIIRSELDRSKISNQIREIVTPLYTLTGSLDYKLEHNDITVRPDMNNMNKEITVAYADFYPNNLIVNSITTLLEDLGFKVSLTIFSDFGDYMKIDVRKFDVSLHLSFPLYLHGSSYVKAFILDIAQDSKRQETITALNEGNVLKLNQLLQSTEHYVPLFLGKSIYLSKTKIEGYVLNASGYLSLENLKYSE